MPPKSLFIIALRATFNRSYLSQLFAKSKLLTSGLGQLKIRTPLLLVSVEHCKDPLLLHFGNVELFVVVLFI